MTRPLAALLLALLCLGACSNAATRHDATRTPATLPSTSTGRHASTAPPAPAAPIRSSPAHAVAVRAPRPGPCAHNTAPRLVKVSLHQQRLWLCARARVAFTTAITSGMAGPYTSTPTGHYAIQGVTRDTTLTLVSGATYRVRYWIPFDGPLFGFHDASWQTFPYGSARYRTDGSHGCVHLPLEAMAFLARWAQVGTPVVIRT